jgi:hypothetical protein
MMRKSAACSALLAAALCLAPSVVLAVPSPVNWDGSSDLGDLVVTAEAASIDVTEGGLLRRAAYPFDPPARVDPAVATLPSLDDGIVHLFSGRLLEGSVRLPERGGPFPDGNIRVVPSDARQGIPNSPEGGGPDSSAPVGDQVAAPEPATVILLGLGLASLSARRLTSRKR